MDPTADELAGVVDVFGTLTRAEIREAVSELAFKRDEDVPDVDAAIDDAVASYHLVGIDHDGERLLAPGPTAFPTMPEGSEDLPHILDVPERDVDRRALVVAVAERFREEAVVAVRSENEAFVDRLLDVSYELEAWGDLDVSATRENLLEVRDGLAAEE